MNKELLERGCLNLPSISEQKCDNILKQLDKLPFQQWQDEHKITGFDFKLARSNIYEVKDHKLTMAIPEVKEIANDPNTMKLVSDYLGSEPIQTQCDAWWSVNHNKPEGGQQFHRDATYKKFIKLYLYLNDVTMENGPHVYVPGSVNNMIIPKGRKFKLSSRIDDKFIKDNYSEIVYITGKKGSLNLVDTTGWHKGLPLKKGHRILIQFEWATDTIDRVTGKQLTYL